MGVHSPASSGEPGADEQAHGAAASNEARDALCSDHKGIAGKEPLQADHSATPVATRECKHRAAARLRRWCNEV